MENHYRVVRCLKTLNEQNLRELGGALGLSYLKLRDMTPQSLRDEMVCAWLNEEDNVIEQSGEPSWKSLKLALHEIGQNGVAATITQGNYVYAHSGWLLHDYLILITLPL